MDPIWIFIWAPAPDKGAHPIRIRPSSARLWPDREREKERERERKREREREMDRKTQRDSNERERERARERERERWLGVLRYDSSSSYVSLSL